MPLSWRAEFLFGLISGKGRYLFVPVFCVSVVEMSKKFLQCSVKGVRSFQHGKMANSLDHDESGSGNQVGEYPGLDGHSRCVTGGANHKGRYTEMRKMRSEVEPAI
jgi:hypothetical protein